MSALSFRFRWRIVQEVACKNLIEVKQTIRDPLLSAFTKTKFTLRWRGIRSKYMLRANITDSINCGLFDSLAFVYYINFNEKFINLVASSWFGHWVYSYCFRLFWNNMKWYEHWVDVSDYMPQIEQCLASSEWSE